jgi:serine/threonine protein phosphatase 1
MNGVLYEYFSETVLLGIALCRRTTVASRSIYKIKQLSYPRRLLLYKEIYIGHTPVTKIEEHFNSEETCVWNVDTGAAFKRVHLTILDVNSKEFWQSEYCLLYILTKREINSDI